ncbi:MAG: CocE/NonD family hydrolase [Acidobacteria bacterium]|nr:CocE/NonD family hydrolase [Acidobacteriota bacterium]
MGQWTKLLSVLGVIVWFAGIAQAWPEERAATNKFTCKEMDIPMRDGLKLKADLYLPEGGGRFPVILERTPYDKNDCDFQYAPYLAERGYAVVIVDVRGRFRSPGVFYNYLNDGWGTLQDGYDTIEWVGTQAWSTGKVGTLGLSHSCFNQNLTAVTQPPHLTAMFCSDSASNWYKDLIYQGGVFQQSTADWDLRRFPYSGSMDDWTNWWKRRMETGLSYWDAWQPQRMTDMLSHTVYDDHWKQFAADEHVEKFTVPVYYTGGWYDRFPHSAVKMFAGIRERGGSKLARESAKLLIGPWLHGQGRTGRTSQTGDMDFGRESMVHFGALEVRWFDYHLRGIDNGIMKEPPVRIFVMGANRWREENEFPIKRAVETKFYFHSQKSGSVDSLNDGTLSLVKPPAGDKPDTYQYDPRNPVPTVGGDLFLDDNNGVKDHRPADRRSLTFTTEPFAENMEIIGPSTVQLYVSSTADDTDFIVTLVDVHPNGYAEMLRQNAQRASRRDSLEKPTPIEPGKVYQLTIPIVPISNLFLKGHRLRLTVTSSSFPRYLPIRNKFALNSDETPIVVAENTIYHDSQYPSSLIVPVIPAGSGSSTMVSER